MSISSKSIKKELIKINEIPNIKQEFLKVNKTDFINFKSNLETKISIIKLVEKIIRKKNKKISILEIGAGYGDFSIVCIDLLGKKIKQYVATELNKNKVDIIRKNIGFNKKVEIKKLDVLYPTEFNYKYDLIIFSEVLEHLTDIEKELAFVNINKLLNKGGYLIISCPITEYLGKRLFYSTLSRGIKNRVKLDYKTIRSHIAVPSITKIISLFYRKGFDNVKIKPLKIMVPFKKRIEPIINATEFFFSVFPRWFRVYLSPGVVVIGQKIDSLDNNWYNNIEYLIKYLPSPDVSEGKLSEEFMNYKYIKERK